MGSAFYLDPEYRALRHEQQAEKERFRTAAE
jgi:hypothetical protein